MSEQHLFILHQARSVFWQRSPCSPERGGATILDLLDAARTSRLSQQNYIETLFSYQRNVFLLESVVGQEITL